MTSPASQKLENTVGVVAIGRNEGERLKRCLTSVQATGAPCVYVDSQSDDNSIEIARASGADVVELDISGGFTAAKARNAGFRQLIAANPDLSYVQFIDGDCELVAGWLETAVDWLTAHSAVAVVAGRRRERFRDDTIFNRHCDMEWATPTGFAATIGGDALYRIDAFEDVGGFNDAFICGEEPELCRRLRIAGWKVERIDVEMTLHDAAITSWAQWWKRTKRGGWAFAEGADRFGGKDAAFVDNYNVKETRSIWRWGAIIPMLIIAASILAIIGVPGAALAAYGGVLLYPLMSVRIAIKRIGDHGDRVPDALIYGALTMLGKIPEFAGALKYYRSKKSDAPAELIEYKAAGSENSR